MGGKTLKGKTLQSFYDMNNTRFIPYPQETQRDPMELVEGPSMEQVLYLMRCRSCKRFPVQQPFSCEAGHSLCYECTATGASGLGKCPCLKHPGFSVKCGRAVLKSQPGPFWKLYLNSKFLCPNLGCEGVYYGRDLGNHTQNCNFRFFRVPVVCQVTDCVTTNVLSLPVYFKHIQEVHRVPRVQSINSFKCHVFLPSRGIRFPNVWICKIFEAFGKEFILCVKEDSSYFDFFGFVLAEFDDKIPKPSYFIRIEIPFGQGDELSGIRWRGRILPVSKTIAEAEDLGANFSVKKQLVFHNLLGDRDYWPIDVRIEQSNQSEMENSSKFPFPILKKPGSRPTVPQTPGIIRPIYYHEVDTCSSDDMDFPKY